MKCGRLRCRTPRDDVQQLKAMTLCKTHRHVLQAYQALKEAMDRLTPPPTPNIAHKGSQGPSRPIGLGVTK